MGVGDAESGTAGGVKREISGSLTRGINAKRLCSRLKSKDAQMCELKYEKKIDIQSVNLNKLRVKELRKICDDEGIDTKGASAKRHSIAGFPPPCISTERAYTRVHSRDSSHACMRSAWPFDDEEISCRTGGER